MNTSSIRTISLLLACSGFLAAQGNRPPFTTGQIIVQERAGASPAAVNAAFRAVGANPIHQLQQTKHDVLSVPDGQADKIIATLLSTGLFTVAERDGRAYPNTTPNDPSFSSQWHLAAINAPTAWNYTVGSPQTIAVIDSGVDSTHPDLAGRIAPGWNFVLGNSNTADDYGHGTATFGTIGAATNDGVGVAGVTWTNPVMPLLVLDSNGNASYSNIASAIEYAADHGARVVNISLAGTASSSTLQSAVNYAWNKGTVIFAAAGNSSSTTPVYPAACSNVVAIAATDNNNALATFSNYGSWIDLSAPGINILTTDMGGGYGYWYGTSFASPVAAGVAALVLGVKPSLSASGLVSLLEQNADNIGSSSIFGFGLVDAAKSVAAAQASTSTPAPSIAISAPSVGSIVSGTVNVTGTAASTLGISSVTLYCDGQTVSSTSSSGFAIPWNTASVAAGGHTLTTTVIDNGGNSASASVAVNVGATASVVDTTPPSIQITSPGNGALVSGLVTIVASAQDNVGVVQVTIGIDGVQAYSGTSGPYSFKWNTKKVTSGKHTITASAWDAAGNHTTTSITVTK